MDEKLLLRFKVFTHKVPGPGGLFTEGQPAGSDVITEESRNFPACVDLLRHVKTCSNNFQDIFDALALSRAITEFGRVCNGKLDDALSSAKTLCMG